MRPVGYYVHHQGEGHRQRAGLLARHLRRPVTLLGTGLDPCTTPSAVDLPDDRLADSFDGRDGQDARPACLHYAPLGHAGIRERMATLAAWMSGRRPALLIVDVSVEVALLARLLSVPTIVVRLAGDRSDPPHLEAYRSAERLVAPFPEVLEHDGTAAWVRRKTIYAGFLSRPAAGPGGEAGDGRVVVLLGRGGGGPSLGDLAAAARAVPDRPWHVLGHLEPDGIGRPPNLHLHGWVDDVARHLAAASLVVGSGGDGVVAAVAASGRRFICLPEPRAFREQAAKAEALARMGAALVHEGWPDPGEWPRLLAAALHLDPGRLAGMIGPRAVEDLARRIDDIADRCERGRFGAPSEDAV